jgi:serine/threonine protein kinase
MNIVVDPSHMIPGGSHFLNQSRAPNGVDYIYDYTGDDSIPHFKKSRTEAGPMHYYFIDFGVSVHFPSFEARTHVTGEVGRLREHNPEISETAPYDPFKVDVWLVGEMLLSEFLLVCLLVQ